MASNGVEIVGGLRFINETESIINEGLNNGHGDYHRGIKRGHGDDSDTDSEIACALQDGGDQLFNMGQGGSECPKPGKKTKGRVKIKMEFIENKLRRYTTFSKRKTGIMKKVYFNVITRLYYNLDQKKIQNLIGLREGGGGGRKKPLKIKKH